MPRAASWAQKTPSPHSITGMASTTSTSLARVSRRGGAPRQIRSSGTPLTDTRIGQSRSGIERKSAGTPLSQTSASRPSTPLLGMASDSKTPRKDIPIPKSTNSPAPSATAESDGSSLTQDRGLPSSRPSSPGSAQSPMTSMLSMASLIPAVPPGLVAPPGIAPLGRPPRVATASPQTPLLSSQSSYQMSTAARALLDDVKARREAPLPAIGYSPFPDFDRTLQTLSGGDSGGFSFNFDPKLAQEVEALENLGDFEDGATVPFTSSYVDSFPSLRNPGAAGMSHLGPPPGLSHPANHSIYDPLNNKPELPQQAQRSYAGSFNPFADSSEDEINTGSSRTTGDAEERKFSRFTFARSKQNPSLMSSPPTMSGPGFHSPRENHAFYGAVGGMSPNLQQHWSPVGHQEFNYSQPVSNVGSPLLQQTQAQTVFPQSAPRFQPFEADLSEAQLREFIQSSRERANVHQQHPNPQGNSLACIDALSNVRPV